ncbi:hypothetical protein, partial [Enterobacter hormaechei]|uniref:hypothetical protein n=1 Tax=Enterobacter hormaechei TaxID=158836 RepID=UPI001EE4AD3B
KMGAVQVMQISRGFPLSVPQQCSRQKVLSTRRISYPSELKCKDVNLFCVNYIISASRFPE